MRFEPKLFHPTRCAMAVFAVCAGISSAHAFEFETESGWKGNLSTTVSLGASWRAESPDSRLFSNKDGARIGQIGTGGSNTDSGTLNWDKGDRFTTPLKAVVDFSMHRNEMGVFARAKTWYDQALNDENARVGNGDNGYAVNQPLSDASQPSLNKFNGIALLDAYVYNTFDVGDHPLQIRAGKQVVNWGESLFIQGMNQLNPIDVPALRKPGTEIKEALLPVWSLYGNLGLGGGMSIEAFYQLKWEPHNVDSCGLYWSPIEFSLSTSAGAGCQSTLTTAGLGFSNPNSITNGRYLSLANGKDGKDSGQWGLSFRIPVDVIESEVGLYAMQINSRSPIVSGKLGSGFGAAALGLAPGSVRASGYWEYPDNINIYGASISGNVAGWSVGAEVSHTPNQPVQINGNDLLASLVYGAGPMGTTAVSAAAGGTGAVVQGYDRLAKTQLQFNTIKILPQMIGADRGLLMAEVGMQWNDLPNNGRRYGRGFIFGFGSDPTYSVPALGSLPGGNTCLSASVNPQSDGCKNDGYVTDFAWGYRIKASLDYPSAFGSAYTLTPSVYFGHDVDGFSSDGQFSKGRQVVTLGLKADYQKKFQVDVGYTTYANNAKYDQFRDRDYYSASVSYSF